MIEHNLHEGVPVVSIVFGADMLWELVLGKELVDDDVGVAVNHSVVEVENKQIS